MDAVSHASSSSPIAPLDITIPGLAIHLLREDAEIDDLQASSHPREFTQRMVEHYNAKIWAKRQEEHAYQLIFPQYEEERAEAHSLAAYFSRTRVLHPAGLLLSRFLHPEEDEESGVLTSEKQRFTAGNTHFLFFLYFQIQKPDDSYIWRIFTLTTGEGYRLVRSHCDYLFPSSIAFRLFDPNFLRKETHPISGPKHSSVSLHKTPYALDSHLYKALWTVYNNFDTTCKLGCSLYPLLKGKVKPKEKISIHMGEGMIRIGLSLSLQQYFTLLPHLLEIRDGKPTEDVKGNREENDKRFEPIRCMQRVPKERADELDHYLLSLLWQVVTKTKESRCGYYIAHRYYRQYYASTRFELRVRQNFHVSWYYPPTFEQIIEELQKYYQSSTYEDFASDMQKNELKCNGIQRGKFLPLMQFIQGEYIYDNTTYFKIDGNWFKVVAEHLASIEQNFLSMLQDVVSTSSNHRAHFLPESWVSKENWIVFSSHQPIKDVSRQEVDNIIKALRNKHFSFITNGRVILPYLTRAVFSQQSARVKLIKKKWAELENWLKINERKSVTKDSLIDVMTPGFHERVNVTAEQRKKAKKKAKEIFDLLSKEYPRCVPSSGPTRDKSFRYTPIDQEGNVLFCDLLKLKWPNKPQYLQNPAYLCELSQTLENRQKTGRAFTLSDAHSARFSISSERKLKSVIKHLKKSYPLIVQDQPAYFLIQGPFPENFRCHENLREKLRECHQNYRKVEDEEGFNRRFLSQPNYLVFDQVFPGEREKIEVCDLLYYGEDHKLYLYAIKEGVGAPTGIACTQLRVASEAVTGALRSGDDSIFRQMYRKATGEGTARSGFRSDLREKIKADFPNEEMFIELFRREIIFVYAFLDTNEFNRLIEDEAYPKDPVLPADIDALFQNVSSTEIIAELQRHQYIDLYGRLKNQFLRENIANFRKNIHTVPKTKKDELYHWLWSKVSRYDSLIAKLELLNLHDHMKKLGCLFYIQQIERPGPSTSSFRRDIIENPLPLPVGFQPGSSSQDRNNLLGRSLTREEVFCRLVGIGDVFLAQRVLIEKLSQKEEASDVCRFLHPGYQLENEDLCLAAKASNRSLTILHGNDPMDGAVAGGDSSIRILHGPGDRYYEYLATPLPVYGSIPSLEEQIKVTRELAESIPALPFPPRGLINKGTDCFVNAVLQLLIHSSGGHYLFHHPLLASFGYRYQEVQGDLYVGQILREKVNLLNEQQDAAEFLDSIIEMLLEQNEDFPRPLFSKTYTTNSDSSYIMLSQEFNSEEYTRPNEEREEIYHTVAVPIPSQGVSFQDCWNAFLRSDSQDTYKYIDEDPDGNLCLYEMQSYTEKRTLKNAPEILICYLKRFSYDQNTGILSKNCDSVDLQEGELTFDTEENGTVTYRICGVIEHQGDSQGDSMDSGHYICHLWHRRQQQWITFDDTEVTSKGDFAGMQEQLGNGYIFLLEKKPG